MAIGLQEFQALFDRCSNWGRWGADDELGTLNLITPAVRVRAASQVREGFTVSCALPINTAADVDNIRPGVHLMIRAGDVVQPDAPSVSDYLAIAPHGLAHSHLDALCHFSWKGQLYNGRPASVVTSVGATANAITIGKDGIVSRGVLMDVPRLKGSSWLEPGTPITVADIEAAERAQGVTVESGDILLVYTGRWKRRRQVSEWSSRESLAGLHHDVPLWLRERGVSLLGFDGISDVIPHAVDGVGLPIHTLTLAAMGMQLLDNQNLEELSDACAERRRWEFMLVIAPLRIERGTASMTNPIAIF
ncbi:MAG: cyclase family protein [Chloroflexota bacterium]